MLDTFQRPFLGAPSIAPILALDTRPRPSRRTSDGRLIGKTLRPSAGVQADYEARLQRLIDEMHRSCIYWLTAAYRRADDRIIKISGITQDSRYNGIESGSTRGSDALTECKGIAHADPLSLGVVKGRIPLAGGLGGGVDTAATVDPPPLHRIPLAAFPRRLAGRSASGPGGGTLANPPPSLALDARPSSLLDETIRRLRRRWLRRFDQGAQQLARYFATAIWKRSDTDLKRILKQANMSVEFEISRETKDALSAIVHENVALIRSIPEQYLRRVETSVMRSVSAGRDLASLTADLQYHHGVTRRRAEFIAIDQNNKATSAINRLGFLELGIERAIWMHSHAGRVPRPTHVANDNQEYDVRRGWYDKSVGAFIRPGELINCRCTSRPVLPR